MYFVTICSKNKECIFGEIKNGIVGLSDEGCIVAQEIQKTSIIRPYVNVDMWCVMPNHVHMLLDIDDQCGDVASPCRGMARHAPTDEMPLRHFAQPIAKSLGTIIGSFKSAATKRINEFRNSPGADVWQRNYYERVVRTEQETIRIRRYIMDNPINWMIDDDENPLLA